MKYIFFFALIPIILAATETEFREINYTSVLELFPDYWNQIKQLYEKICTNYSLYSKTKD